MQGVIESRQWDSRADLAEAYLNWGGYAYGAGDDGTPARERFAQRLAGLQAVLHNQDNREHDLLDSNDYYQFQGGMLAAAEVIQRALTVASYHGDHSQPDNPRIRTLKEELGRVVRSRAVNPKWIAGMKRHGYKGAFELAATVDYLFAFDATSELVDDHQYRLLADAYLLDADTREFIRQHNPEALRDIAERLVEAQQRGLWEEPGEPIARRWRICWWIVKSSEGFPAGVGTDSVRDRIAARRIPSRTKSPPTQVRSGALTCRSELAREPAQLRSGRETRSRASSLLQESLNRDAGAAPRSATTPRCRSSPGSHR